MNIGIIGDRKKRKFNVISDNRTGVKSYLCCEVQEDKFLDSQRNVYGKHR